MRPIGAVGAQQVLLAHHLGQRRGPQPVGEGTRLRVAATTVGRRRGGGGFGFGTEEVGGSWRARHY